MQRRCDIAKTVDGNWYMMLGNFEYAEKPEDCTFYGPFSYGREAEQYLQENFSNPGAIHYYEAGNYPVPMNAVRPMPKRPVIFQ